MITKHRWYPAAPSWAPHAPRQSAALPIRTGLAWTETKPGPLVVLGSADSAPGRAKRLASSRLAPPRSIAAVLARHAEPRLEAIVALYGDYRTRRLSRHIPRWGHHSRLGREGAATASSSGVSICLCMAVQRRPTSAQPMLVSRGSAPGDFVPNSAILTCANRKDLH